MPSTAAAIDTRDARSGDGPDRRLTWTAYGLMLAQGFTVYSVSYITPYVESELHAPTWASSAPNDAMALGFLAAAAVVPLVIRLAGPLAAIRTWALGLVVAVVLIASASSIAAVVAGAFLVGLANAGIIVHTVSAIAARANGLYMVRASMWAMVGGVLGPMALVAATRTTGWNTGVLAVVPLALVVAALLPPSPAQAPAGPAPAGARATHEPAGWRALGRAYWTAWLYLVLTIGGEFAFVAWGAQVAVARTGIALVDATALASLFVTGELIGRAAWGARFGGRADRVRTLRRVTLIAIAGAILLWFAPVPAVAAVGLLLGGLGIALMYPVTSSLAVVYAAHAPVVASARLNIASGIAILGAPLVLGIAAGAVGVTAAWVLALVLLGGAWLVVLRLPRPGPPEAPNA